jgi:hypothetical protein
MFCQLCAPGPAAALPEQLAVCQGLFHGGTVLLSVLAHTRCVLCLSLCCAAGGPMGGPGRGGRGGPGGDFRRSGSAGAFGGRGKCVVVLGSLSSLRWPLAWLSLFLALAFCSQQPAEPHSCSFARLRTLHMCPAASQHYWCRVPTGADHNLCLLCCAVLCCACRLHGWRQGRQAS